MEIEITHLLDLDLTDYSASKAELGENAGRITWNNSLESGLIFVSSEDEKQSAREYIREFGAWSKEEIDAWTAQELNALVLQMIAGDLRRYLDAKEELGDEGNKFEEWISNHGGNIYEGNDGKLYYCLSF